MIQFTGAKHPETGRETIVATAQYQETIDPLSFMRGLKQMFPGLWQQVNMEIQLPPSAVKEASKIIGVNGD